jgi:hypothetical protein
VSEEGGGWIRDKNVRYEHGERVISPPKVQMSRIPKRLAVIKMLVAENFFEQALDRITPGRRRRVIFRAVTGTGMGIGMTNGDGESTRMMKMQKMGIGKCLKPGNGVIFFKFCSKKLENILRSHILVKIDLLRR